VGADVYNNFPEFQITINDTNPIWGYCSQTGHCQQGMVFSINAPVDGTNTFAAFQQLALKSNGTKSSAGEALGGAFTPKEKAKAKAIAKGVLIAIIAGVVGLVLLSLLVCYCCCCRRHRNREIAGGQGGGFMGLGAAKYRSLNEPAPVAAVDTHLDSEPLVLSSEKHGEANDYYNPESTYDPPPPPPMGGQYSTAWDQHK